MATTPQLGGPVRSTDGPLRSFSSATTAVVEHTRQNSLGDVLRRTALQHPGKLAVAADGRRVTYAEFDRAVNRCANALVARGLHKGDRLALLSRNSWQFAVLTFATARAGVVLVPINFSLGATEVAYILEHCAARGLVAGDAFVLTADEALARSNLTSGVVRARSGVSDESAPAPGWEDVDDWIDAPGDETAPTVSIADDDPLRMMYTSGTESRPKGVLLSSRSLIAQYVSCAIDGDMGSDDVDLHSLPMYHCAQLDCFFAVDIFLGATSVVLPAPDPAAILRAVERDRVTKLFAPPTVWISLLRHPDWNHRDLSSLRKGYYGASAMPVEILRELTTRLPNVRFWNLYGQTEMAPVATMLRPDEQLVRAGSAGRPTINVETRIVDDEDRTLPTGEVGEIVHRSPHACLGYYADEARTAEAFRCGWFHSGDLGFFDAEGYLWVVDRKKDMIKTGGENVSSREVEEALYRCDDLAEVAVFGVEHPRWIEAVTAAVVLKPGRTVTPDQVRAHAREHLAGYKCPKFVVVVDDLPRNPSGKILKRELRIQHAALASTEY